MADTPFHHQPTCSVCASRPATVQVVVATEQGRQVAPMCEQCAREIAEGITRAGQAAHQPQSKTPALDEFSRDLTADAAEGRIDPVIGREAEIAQTIEILSRRRKNNAVLIGEAGVGKTAIAEGLARAIDAEAVPEALREVRVLALDLGSMVAGSQYRGQFEQRLKTVLAEVAAAKGEIILFLDELHTVLGAGGAEGSMDAANLLKPMLARGELRMVGATTLTEFRKIERDSALARRFSQVMVEEPTVEQTITILHGLREAYEAHHELRFDDGAIEAAARLSDRYLPEQRLPDKAIDLLDQAGAKHRLAQPTSLARRARDLEERIGEAVTAEDYEKAAAYKQQLVILKEQEQPASGDHAEPDTPIVDAEQIAAVVAARTGIPVGELHAGDLERLGALEADLHKRVVGQDEAVSKIADTIRRSRVGLSEHDRPLGSFLFLGPTGVGKTELVKTLAARLFASEDNLVRIDMSEFRAPHTVARLIGSPPGYVGYGDGGQLTEPVRRRPYSVILLDEVEKAHPEVWNVLLQLLDDGRLTDGEGRTVDFTNAVVVMTSNLGAGQAKRHALGFAAEADASDDERSLKAVKESFLPEFLNRIDEIVTFHSLDHDQIGQIARMVVGRVADRLLSERGITLTVSDQLIERLAADGFDEEFGARPLQRHVRRTLERELTEAIVSGQLSDGGSVHASNESGSGDVVLEITPITALSPVLAA